MVAPKPLNLAFWSSVVGVVSVMSPRVAELDGPDGRSRRPLRCSNRLRRRDFLRASFESIELRVRLGLLLAEVGLDVIGIEDFEAGKSSGPVGGRREVVVDGGISFAQRVVRADDAHERRRGVLRELLRLVVRADREALDDEVELAVRLPDRLQPPRDSPARPGHFEHDGPSRPEFRLLADLDGEDDGNNGLNAPVCATDELVGACDGDVNKARAAR
jgi:hypothetical protein